MSTMGGRDSSKKFERIPEKFSAVVDEDIDVIEEAKKGYERWAACIDMRNGNVYFGTDHADIKKRRGIPETAYCKAIVHIDKNLNVTAPYIFDYRRRRKGTRIESGPMEDRLLSALRRDVLKVLE